MTKSCEVGGQGNKCERGRDLAVLACTELPLMIKPEDVPIPVIDTMRVHIAAIVEHMTNK